MKHVATFSNGRIITRESDYPFTHAWAIFRPNDTVVKSGFSRSFQQAKVRAQLYMPKSVTAKERKKILAGKDCTRDRRDQTGRYFYIDKPEHLSAEDWLKQIDNDAAQYLSKRHLEIVELDDDHAHAHALARSSTAV